MPTKAVPAERFTNSAERHILPAAPSTAVLSLTQRVCKQKPSHSNVQKKALIFVFAIHFVEGICAVVKFEYMSYLCTAMVHVTGGASIS